MKAFGFDVRRVAVTFLLTSGLLAGGRIAAYHVQVERPVKAYLSECADVLGYSLVGTSSGPEIHVRLADVRDIQFAYRHLAAGLAQAAGKTRFQVVLEDARTGELADVYQHMRLSVEEAISRGTFREMATAIDAEASAARLDRWGVYVDSGHVYVQLHKGGRYLYDVIPRQGDSAAANDALTSPPAGKGLW